jgi:hypothetical protein
MKPLVVPAVLLTLATMSRFAYAGEQDIRSCDFEVKARCVSGDARVTLADGVVLRVEINVLWCGLRRGAPSYSCMIDSSRGDGESTWSDDAGATLIANGSPFNPDQPDRVKVAVGRDVTIDFNEAQSVGRCGAGAELPKSIVIPAQGKTCQMQLRAP